MNKRAVSLILVVMMLLFGSAWPAWPVGAAASAEDRDGTPFADVLRELGVFSGTGGGYELALPVTRVQGAVMLVRLAGKGENAAEEQNPHPYADVPDWAGDYIGYVYEHDLMDGLSEDEFGAGEPLSAAEYAASLLGALGYDDDDFGESLEALAQFHIISEEDAEAYGESPVFRRGELAALSHAALLAAPKGSYFSWLHHLFVEDGAFTPAQLAAAARIDPGMARVAAMTGSPYADGKKVLDAEGIYQKSAAAVFRIDAYEDDEIVGNGSGFFITPDGIAVTNYHVLETIFEYELSSRARLFDGEEYDIEYVLGYSEEEDIALIKIDGDQFPHLTLGYPDKLRVGQRIYCVGSPESFEGTISDGLVSSPVRQFSQIEDRELIQISAPITYGSSGGALFNEYGDVVGVTAMGYEGNLNFCVPVTALSKMDYLDPPKTLSQMAGESGWDDIWRTGDTVPEEEPNDDDPAQTLESDTLYTGTLKDEDDADLYTIEADGSTEILLMLRADEAYIGLIDFEVVDAETGETALRSRLMPNVPYRYIDDHLKEGEYVLRVSAGDGEDVRWSNVKYEFACYLQESMYYPTYPFENEIMVMGPNGGSFDEAQYFSYGGYVGAEMENDMHYYRFCLDEDMDTSFMFMAWDLEGFSVELYADTRELITALEIMDFWEEDEFPANTMTLEAGAYYVTVQYTSEDTSSWRWDSEYFLYIGNLSDDWEF